MASQDDVRENAQKKLFDLSNFSESGRGNVYTPDGTTTVEGQTFTFELKSKPQKKRAWNKKKQEHVISNVSSVSTARGFGAKKVDEWEEQVDIFLFSEFSGIDFDGTFKEHIAATYDDIFPIIEEKVLTPYNEGRAPRHNSDGYFGMKEYEEKILPILERMMTQEDVIRFTHTMEVGNALNDPKFPWKKIKEVGTTISNKEDLEAYCKDLLNKGYTPKGTGTPPV